LKIDVKPYLKYDLLDKATVLIWGRISPPLYKGSAYPSSSLAYYMTLKESRQADGLPLYKFNFWWKNKITLLLLYSL